jgi:hypothetical protein
MRGRGLSLKGSAARAVDPSPNPNTANRRAARFMTGHDTRLSSQGSTVLGRAERLFNLNHPLIFPE